MYWTRAAAACNVSSGLPKCLEVWKSWISRRWQKGNVVQDSKALNCERLVSHVVQTLTDMKDHTRL